MHLDKNEINYINPLVVERDLPALSYIHEALTTALLTTSVLCTWFVSYYTLSCLRPLV